MKRFWLLGYDATSVRDLADTMGIAQPSLYAAFGSKSALFFEAVQAFERKVGFLDMSAITAAPSLSEGVDRQFENLVKRLTKAGSPKGCMILGGVVADIPGQRDLVLHLRGRRSGYRAALSAALQTWLPVHQARSEAAHLTMVALGLSTLARDGDRAPQLREIARRAAVRIG